MCSDTYMELPRSVCLGVWIYIDGVIFAIIASDSELLFKADESPQRFGYEARVGKQYVYTVDKNKKHINMSYWTVLEEIRKDRYLIEGLAGGTICLSHKEK